MRSADADEITDERDMEYEMTLEEMKTLFPKLSETSCKITSKANRRYNCIAWALCDKTVSYWPHGLYWPRRIRCDESPLSFQELFEMHGYEICDNQDFEAAFEKIALFANGGRVKHSARQLQNGWWASKIGNSNDIIHESLCALEADGPDDYGRVIFVMRRVI